MCVSLIWSSLCFCFVLFLVEPRRSSSILGLNDDDVRLSGIIMLKKVKCLHFISNGITGSAMWRVLMLTATHPWLPERGRHTHTLMWPLKLCVRKPWLMGKYSGFCLLLLVFVLCSHTHMHVYSGVPGARRGLKEPLWSPRTAVTGSRETRPRGPGDPNWAPNNSSRCS